MIKIAIVEDDLNNCREYSNFLKQFAMESGEAIQIFEFHDGDEIVENYSAN